MAKTLQVHLKAYRETFAEYNFFPEDIIITTQVFGDWNGPAKLGVPNPQEFTKKYLQRLDESFVDAPLYPNVIPTLETLSKSKKLALITSSTIRLIRPAIQQQKVEKYFPIVLAAEDVITHKPDPEIIEKSLFLLGGNKEEAIIVGDSKSDLGAAVNAGIDSVLFFPDDHTLFYQKKNLMKYSPTHVIIDHKELLKILV